jgi:hypothetical protein
MAGDFIARNVLALSATPVANLKRLKHFNRCRHCLKFFNARLQRLKFFSNVADTDKTNNF